MSQITDTQLVFLDNLIYLNLFYFDNNTLIETINAILEEPDKYCLKEDPPAAMTKEQWVQLLTSFRDNPANTEFLKNYKITNYVTNDTDTNGFRAACFVNINDTTDVAAIFRGTYGGIEWEDDFLMANDVWSEEMDKAIHYINSLPAEYGNNIDVSGHSKGGNKSQYVTILTDRIGRCVSFDGQGFSKEFIDLYADIIEERKHKITSISGQHDYVNALLFPIASSINFVQTDYDSNFGLNHCPNKVFDENGNLRAYSTDIKPALYASFISYLTQKPLSELPDGMTTEALFKLTEKVVVPLLDLDKEKGIDWAGLALDFPYLIGFFIYLAKEAIPISDTSITMLDIVEAINNGLDNHKTNVNKNQYLTLVREYISIYNHVANIGSDPFNDEAASQKLEAFAQLEKIKAKLLDYGSGLLSESAFYSDLSAEDTKLLSEFLEISKNDARNTKDYDLMLDRLSYILERFGETKTALYDPLVIDMGKTGFFTF